MQNWSLEEIGGIWIETQGITVTVNDPVTVVSSRNEETAHLEHLSGSGTES